MAGVTAQSFLSAATGMAVAIALVRGFARRSSETIGNTWVDLTRATLYILLPISIIGALFSRIARSAANPWRSRQCDDIGKARRKSLRAVQSPRKR